MVSVTVALGSTRQIHAFLTVGSYRRDLGPGEAGLKRALGILRDHSDAELGVLRDLRDKKLGEARHEAMAKLRQISDALKGSVGADDLPEAYSVGLNLADGKFFAVHKSGEDGEGTVIADGLDELSDAINAALDHQDQMKPT